MIVFRAQDIRFCLDHHAGLLWRGQERVHLPRKGWEVLRYLAENPDKLISTQDQRCSPRAMARSSRRQIWLRSLPVNTFSYSNGICSRIDSHGSGFRLGPSGTCLIVCGGQRSQAGTGKEYYRRPPRSSIKRNAYVLTQSSSAAILFHTPAEDNEPTARHLARYVLPKCIYC